MPHVSSLLKRARSCGLTLLALVLCCVPLSVFAGSLVVAPTTIRMTSAGDTGILYVTNTGDAPLTAQIEGYQWSQAGGQDVLRPAPGVIVSPPLAHIAPSATQTIRFGFEQTGDGTTEQTFRLIVSEIPELAAAGPNTGVRMLLQFSVPVFIAPSGLGAGALTWDAVRDDKTLTITAHNIGARHIKLTALNVKAGSKAPLGTMGLFYLLPGNTRVWSFPAPDIQPGDQVDIEGVAETGTAPFDANLTVHR